MIVNLDSLALEKQKKCIRSIEENIKELKQNLKQNIQEKEYITEIPETGMAVLLQQFVLVETIEKWIETVKKKWYDPF